MVVYEKQGGIDLQRTRVPNFLPKRHASPSASTRLTRRKKSFYKENPRNSSSLSAADLRIAGRGETTEECRFL
jgi:hypothetical protein